MRILVTNDDGYLALGIRALVEAAEAHGDVQVVAPDREQSATSHSLTMHHPLRVRAGFPVSPLLEPGAHDPGVRGRGTGGLQAGGHCRPGAAS